MKPVFLDTSGLIATVNTRDQWHADATEAWTKLIESDSPLVTTSLVLVEIGDGLSRVQYRNLAITLRDRLLGSPRVEVVQIQRRHEERGWQLYRSRADKN